MSLDNFRNRTIIWDTVNKDFPQPIQIMQGDVNARTLLIKIVDNGVEIDLTGHSLKLTYQYTNSSNSGFVMIPPKDLAKGEFILVIPTEMTTTGVIEANLILLNESLEQVIVSKSLTFISDNSTVTDLAQKVNNKIDDFTKLLLENMPQVLRSELNDLHAQTESNKSNVELKANQTDLDDLQTKVNAIYSNALADHKKIETLIKRGIYDYIVDINGTGDFTSVAECVKQAADLSTIYVKNGLYENEIVKAWLKTVFIIGESRDGVIITNSTGEYETPPVEMGTGLLRNLTIYAKDPGGLTPNNKCYALHSEASVYNYYKFEVDNCNIVSDWRSSWGMGMRSGMVYNVRNVNFDGGVYFHDNEHSNGSVQRIFFDTCNMTREDTNEALIIQDQQMSNSVIDVRFNRCLVKSLHGNDIALFKWDAINKNVIPATGFVDFPSWRLNSFSWGNSKATLNA